MYYIYKINCKITGKNYIGKSTIPIQERFHRHLTDAKKLDTHLARAIKLYGNDNFEISLIEECEENLSLLSQREVYWIEVFDSYNTGYNETKGGDGGNTYAKKSKIEMDIIKEKISKSKTGGKNPNAKKIKCKNMNTNEEFTFNSLAECKEFLQETNHQFISRRLTGKTKTLWKETWAFAYADDDYPQYFTTQKNSNSIEIIVIDLLGDNIPRKFMSFSAGERYYNTPNKSFAQSRQIDKNAKEYIVKNRYKITVLN